MPQDSIANIDSLTVLADSLRRVDSVIAVNSQPKSFLGNTLADDSLVPKHLAGGDDWLLVVFLLAFGLLAYLRVSYSKRLSEVVKAAYDNSIARELLRGENFFVQRISLILSLIFLLTISSFIYILLRDYLPRWAPTYGILAFLQIMAAVFLLYILKLAIIRFIGFIFKEQALATEYAFNIVILVQIGGLLVLPVAVLLNYSYLSPLPLLVVALFIFLIAYIIRLFRGFSIGWNRSGVSRLHLFYYFCTLELLPAVILTKSILLLVG